MYNEWRYAKLSKGRATLNEELQHCPHCGRYVIAQDAICPTCGEPLDAPTAQEVPSEAERPAAEAAEPEPLPAEEAELAAAAAEAPSEERPAAEAAEPEPLPAEEAELAAAEVEAPSEERPAAGAAEPEPLPAEEAELAAAEHVSAEAPTPPDALPEKPPSLPDTLGTPEAALRAVEEPPSETGTPPHAITPLSEMAPVPAPEADAHAAISALPTPSEMLQETQPNPAAHLQAAAPTYAIPPAPYTPPPVPYAYPRAADPFAAAVAFLQQRVAAYRHGGYHLLAHGPYEATLAYGKGLSVGAWMLALVSGVGLVWYLLLLALSGFRMDEVTIWVERDGRVYEDGPGAAHVRLQRARSGRRWRTVGAVLFALSVFTALVLVVFAGVVLSQERYQAALRQAYPAVTLFEERFSDAPASAEDVRLAKDGAVAFGVVAALTAVGLWGGATLFVVGTVHASAYRVRVPPLPGWA